MRTQREPLTVPLSHNEIWWLNPLWTVMLLAFVVLSAAYAMPDSLYRYSWKTPKHFGDRALLLCTAIVALFATGCWVGNQRTRPAEAAARDTWSDALPWDLLMRAFRWCYWLALAGYALWAGLAVTRGADLALVWGILRGDKGASALMKDVYLETIAGVTTLTQLGLAAVVLGALIGVARGWDRVRFPMAVLFALAVFRALMNSERLAVIELGIPLLVVLVRLLVLDSPGVSLRWRGLLRVAPLIGACALVLLFAASEYLRSWVNYYSGGDLGFWSFMTYRLMGYYVTAVNNGALLIDQLPAIGLPFFSMNFLWHAPGGARVMDDVFPNMPYMLEANSPVESVLTLHANYEFNNADGYLLPVLDFGVIGALLYWLLAGLVCGILYRSFCRKQPFGLLVYPVVFIGVVELPRILYWGQGRAFPALAVLTLLAFVCMKWRKRVVGGIYV